MRRMGHATQAAVRTSVGGPAAARRGFHEMGYTPRPTGGVRAGVGSLECGDRPDDPAMGKIDGNPWCYNPQQWAPVPMGPNAVVNTVTAAAAGPPLVPGTGTLTFAASEQVIVYSIEITDPSGVLIVTNVVSGRYPVPESPNFPANMFQSGSTACKMFRGVPIYPSSPFVITFANPSLAAVNVQGGLQVVIVPCKMQLPGSLVAFLKQ